MEHTNFKEFEASPGGRRAAGLLGSSGAPLDVMLELIYSEAVSNLGGLSAERFYKTEHLCGPDLWAALPLRSQRCSAGMCMKYLVTSGALPLELHRTKSGSGTKKYFLSHKD